MEITITKKKTAMTNQNMIDFSYWFLQSKKLSLLLLNLGASPVSRKGEEKNLLNYPN